MINCPHCHKNKPSSDFGTRLGERRYICKECVREQSRSYYHEGGGKENKREYYLRRKFTRRNIMALGRSRRMVDNGVV